MSEGARVDSIDAIKEFRVYLTKFQEHASLALGDADSDINRMIRWLESEAPTYWSGQIRKRQEILQKAEEAFRFKRLYKDSSGSMPSAIEEQKAVQVAKRNLDEAQSKLANVKRWNREIQKQLTLYRGGVGKISNAVSALMPQAIAHLGSTIDNLEKYMGIAVESGEPATMEGAAAGGSGAEKGAGSMARAAEEAAGEEEQKIDPAALRAAAPTAHVIAAAPAAEPGPVKLAAGVPAADQAAAIANLAGNGQNPPDDAKIAISSFAPNAKRIYILRQPDTWAIATVDQTDSSVYNTVTAGDLRLGRPDLADILKLAAGSLVVIDSDGSLEVYNQSNEKVL